MDYNGKGCISFLLYWTFISKIKFTVVQLSNVTYHLNIFFFIFNIKLILQTNKGSTSQEKLTASCILFLTVASVSLLAQVAVQLTAELVFTPLAQDLLIAWKRGFQASKLITNCTFKDQMRAKFSIDENRINARNRQFRQHMHTLGKCLCTGI